MRVGGKGLGSTPQHTPPSGCHCHWHQRSPESAFGGCRLEVRNKRFRGKALGFRVLCLLIRALDHIGDVDNCEEEGALIPSSLCRTLHPLHVYLYTYRYICTYMCMYIYIHMCIHVCPKKTQGAGPYHGGGVDGAGQEGAEALVPGT